LNPQALENFSLGSPHLRPPFRRHIVVPHQVQHPVDDQQLQLHIHTVTGVRRLSLSAVERDEHVAQVARRIRWSDEHPARLVSSRKSQHVGRRIHTAVTQVELAQHPIASHHHSQLALRLHPLVGQGGQRGLAQQIGLDLRLERPVNLHFYLIRYFGSSFRSHCLVLFGALGT